MCFRIGFYCVGCGEKIEIEACAAFGSFSRYFFVFQRMLLFKNLTKLLSICPTRSMRRTLRRGIHCATEGSQPSLRFIQFRRVNREDSRLGAVSADGTNFIDLTTNDQIPRTLTKFLKSKHSVELGKLLVNPTIEKVTEHIEILSPITSPEKILAVEPNSLKAGTRTLRPGAFQSLVSSRLPSTVIGPMGTIVLPHGIAKIECRPELAVVIGKEAKHVAADGVDDYIFGYTIGLFVQVCKYEESDRDLNSQLLLANSCDTFCSLGPAVVHKTEMPNTDDLSTSLQVNGVTGQQEYTRDMTSRIPKMIEFISRFISLRPGDVIMTGPPDEKSYAMRCSNTTAMAGDRIDCDIDSIGRLQIDVVAE